MANQVIQSLPTPNKTGGKSLMQSLAERKTTREFTDKTISEQTLSELLWATWGVNREGNWRTVPTSMNHQKIIVFVVKQDGVWRYSAEQHQLEKVMDNNCYKSSYNAPVTLIYVGSQGKYDALHIGALYQNAGLYSASVGLGSVIVTPYNLALVDKLPMPVGYKVFLTQEFGWPA